MESQFVSGGSNQTKKGLAVGIDGMASFASTNYSIGALVEKYRILTQELEKSNLSPKDKIALVSELFITVGHLHAAGIQNHINFNLDVFVEVTKFYHWAIANIKEQDKKYLSQQLNSAPTNVTMQLLNAALQSPLTPDLLINIMDASYVATQAKHLDPNPNVSRPEPETLSKLKFKDRPNLVKKLMQLQELIEHADIESTKISRSRYKHGRNTMFRITGSQPTSPTIDPHCRPVSPTPDSKKNVVTSPVTSPTTSRKNQQPTSPNSGRSRHSLMLSHGHDANESIADLAKKELASMYQSNTLFTSSPGSFAHDFSDNEIAAKQVELFKTYEKISKLAFSILNDPEFQSLEKKQLTEKLFQIVVDCTKLNVSMIDANPALQTAFVKKQQCLQLAHEIYVKLNSQETNNIYVISRNFLGEESPKNEETAIVQLLGLQFDDVANCYQNDQYTLRTLGHGNDRVYLIKDKNTGASVILRGRNVTSTELDSGTAPDQIRSRVCGSLGIDGCATQIYEFMPGGKNDMVGRSLHRNYEISEAMSYGNLEDSLKALYKNLKDGAISTEKFQVEVLENSIKVIKLIRALKEAGICWSDLKPSNILLDEHGNFIISDIKTWLDISPMVDSGEKLTYRSIEPLQLTPGYLTVKASEFKRGEGNTYDIDRVMKETVAFTLYQMITGILDLETKTTYYDSREETINKNFPGQFAQLEKMLATVESSNVLSGPPLGKYIHELAKYVCDLVKDDHSKLESILTLLDSEEFQKALAQAKTKIKSKTDNNNDTPYIGNK